MFFLGVQRWKWNTAGHQIELQLQRIISLFLYPPENARYASGNVQVQATVAAYLTSIAAIYFLVLSSGPQKWSVPSAGEALHSINRILAISNVSFLRADMRLALDAVLSFFTARIVEKGFPVITAYMHYISWGDGTWRVSSWTTGMDCTTYAS